MELFKIFGSVAVKNNEAKASLDDVNNHAKNVATQMGQSFENIGTAFQKIGQGMSKAGTYLTGTLTLGLGALATQGIKYNAQMETFEANLTTLLGSSDKAKSLLSDLQQMASTTPYETTDLISATQTMVGFGISAQDAQKYLNVLGDIAMGDSQKMQGLALAFSQVQSTGKLTGQDLLQMINQGFNPLLYISKMTGKSMSELKEEMSEGKISAKMVGDAFEYATQKGQPFYQAMEKGADTVNGRISTLKDNFNIMIGNLTESLLPIFEKVVDKLIELTEKFSNLSDEQKENILKWAGIAMAIGPVLMVLGKVTSGIGLVTQAFGKLLQMNGVSTMISKFVALCGGAGPAIGVVIAVVVALAGVFVFLKRNWDKVTEAFKNFAENTGLAEKFEEIKSKLQPLWEKIKQLGDLFEVIGGAVVAGLQPAFTILMGLFNGVVSAISPLLDALGGIIDILAGIGKFIKSVFTGDWQGAWDAVKQIGQGIVDVFAGLWNAIVGFLEGFKQGVIGWITGLADTLGIPEMLNKIKTFLSNWWTGTVIPWWQGVWAGVTGFFSSVGEWFNTNVIQPIVNFFKGLWNGIKAVWDGICNVVKVGIMLIGSIISGAVQIITLPFRFIWENCKEYVFTAWEAIKKGVSTAINAVKNTITTVFNAIKTFFTTVWNAIKNTFTRVWNSIVNFLTPIINKIKNTITTVFNAVKSKVTSIFNAIKNTVTTVWNNIKSAVTTAVNAVKSVVTSVFNAIKSTVTSIWNGIKDTISNVWNNIKTGVSNAINGVKSTVTSVFNSVKNTVTNVWNSIKTAIETPINKAKETVKNVVDSIKGFFSNLKLKLPDIKLPHFKIDGKLSLNPPSVPKLKIDWYKDGGIFAKPTIFDTNSGLKGVGEAGPEAVAPISKLQDYVKVAVSNSNTALEEKLDVLADILLKYLPAMQNQQMVLDTGALVGQITTQMDRSLGDLTNKRARGR